VKKNPRDKKGGTEAKPRKKTKNQRITQKKNTEKRRKSKGATQRGGLALQLLSSLQTEKDPKSKPIQSRSASSSPSQLQSC
jgi:hypothetical protein